MIFLYLNSTGTCKMRNETRNEICETEQNETKRNLPKTKRNETERNGTKRNEIKSSEIYRNETKQNETTPCLSLTYTEGFPKWANREANVCPN